MQSIDFGQRERVTVTIRITELQSSFNDKILMMRFRGIPVSPTNHLQILKNEFYYITVPTESLIVEPAKGQIWRITGLADIQMVASNRRQGFLDRKLQRYEDKVVKFYRPNKCDFILPLNAHSFVTFIAEFKGVGKAIAEKLWSVYGYEIFSVLEHKEINKLLIIKGITENKANVLFENFAKFCNLKHAKWLSDKNIPVDIQRQIFRLMHKVKNSNGIEEVVDPTLMIEKNPYSLMSFGLDFKRADMIARRQFKLHKDDPARYIAAVVGALQAHGRSGHTIATSKDLVKKLESEQLLGWKDEAEKALKCAYTNKEFIFDPKTGIYQYTPIYLWENVVALRLLKLKSHSNELDYNIRAKKFCHAVIKAENKTLHEINSGGKLAEKQVEAIYKSVDNAVSCITGGAGTGKTTVLRSVLAVYQKLGYTIKSMALSARAAIRTQESIESLGLKATSIAKFLHEPPLEKITENYLVVIDESSMLDLPTLYRIVLNTEPRVRFLFIGDPEQLPPIGCGKVLADIIHSGMIAYTELDVVQRQDVNTGIPMYADYIKHGRVPPKLSTGNIFFHDVEFDGVAEKCAQLYAVAPNISQVVASVNNLVSEINTLCQPCDGMLLAGCTKSIYLNDPVLFIENNYKEDVQNGTLGKLTAIEPIGVVQTYGTNNEVTLTPELLSIISPAYALTIHKAQGSQFQRVIVAMSAGSFVDRSSFYTAITRAEFELHIVCPEDKLVSIITKPNHVSLRKTNLINLLKTITV